MRKKVHVNLLLLTEAVDGEIVKSHYCWIKNLSRLVSSQCSRTGRKKHFCNRCLHFMSSPEDLVAHKEKCKKLNDCAIFLPDEGQNILKFKHHARKLPVPYIIYAGTECLLGKVDSPNAPKTAYQQHKVHSIGYYLHCEYDSSLSGYRGYRGEDCATWFAEELEGIVDNVSEVTFFSYIWNKKSF